MTLLQRLLGGLRALFRKTRVEQELDAELREYLERGDRAEDARGHEPRRRHARGARRNGQRRSGQGSRARRRLGNDGRERLAGRAIRPADAAAVAGLHGGRGHHARPRHRRQHGGLFRRVRGALPVTAVSRTPSGSSRSFPRRRASHRSRSRFPIPHSSTGRIKAAPSNRWPRMSSRSPC